VIIGYDGKRDALGSPGFRDHVRVNHLEPGSLLKLEVLRRGEVRKLEIKLD
jgi:hypothetical protein